MNADSPLARFETVAKGEVKYNPQSPVAAAWDLICQLRAENARLAEENGRQARELRAARKRNTELHRLLHDEWHDGWCAGRDHALNGWEAAG